MKMPDVLNTDEHVCFAGGSGRDIWATVNAAQLGDIATLRTLLDRQPDLVHCGHYSWLPRDCYRPLHFAVRANHAEAVSFLLSRGAHVMDEFLLNSLNQSLDIARIAGFDEVYSILDTDRRARFGYRTQAAQLARAIKVRDPDRALALVDNDPTMLEAADETGNAPIHWAILTRQATLVNGLHRRGANLDHTRFDGQRPIDLVEGDYWFRTDRTDLGDAVEEDANELVRHMLGLDAKYEMCTAIRLGDLDRVRSLMTVKPSLVNDLSNDPQPPSSAGEHGRRRPIVEAARFNRLNIAELLIGEGVDVNLGVPLWAPYGQALFKACSGGHLTMAQMLLQAGARPNVEVESSGDCFSIMEGQEASTIEQLQALLRSFGGVAVAFND